jgi:hypothetical protein
VLEELQCDEEALEIRLARIVLEREDIHDIFDAESLALKDSTHECTEHLVRTQFHRLQARGVWLTWSIALRSTRFAAFARTTVSTFASSVGLARTLLAVAANSSASVSCTLTKSSSSWNTADVGGRGQRRM